MPCKHPTKSGQRCRATPMKNLSCCFHHNPETSQKRRVARSKGGKNGCNKRHPFLSKVQGMEMTATEIRDLLLEATNGYLHGKVTASTCRHLANWAIIRGSAEIQCPRVWGDQTSENGMNPDQEQYRRLSGQFGESAAKVAMNPVSRRRVIVALNRVRFLMSQAAIEIFARSDNAIKKRDSSIVIRSSESNHLSSLNYTHNSFINVP